MKYKPTSDRDWLSFSRSFQTSVFNKRVWQELNFLLKANLTFIFAKMRIWQYVGTRIIANLAVKGLKPPRMQRLADNPAAWTAIIVIKIGLKCSSLFDCTYVGTRIIANLAVKGLKPPRMQRLADNPAAWTAIITIKIGLKCSSLFDCTYSSFDDLIAKSFLGGNVNRSGEWISCGGMW